MSRKTKGIAKDRIKTTGKKKSKTQKTQRKHRVQSHGTNHFNGKMSGEKKLKRGREQDFPLKQEDKSNLLPHE